MGTITQGQALIDIMNECGYDIAIPGNHEFDYGMTQFNHLIGSANAKYLSCNFTDNRTGAPTLMFDPYTIKEYPLPAGGTVRVAFVGVTTPATLTASSPRSFWRSDDDHTCVYGFCEDETGSKLVQAVQGAVDEARAAGAEFVVLLAHLGQTGQPSQWRSDTLVSRCEGINVVIDGHSHEEYVQIVQDRNGDDVVIAQTGTHSPVWGRSSSSRIREPYTPARTATRPRFCARRASPMTPLTCRRSLSVAMRKRKR